MPIFTIILQPEADAVYLRLQATDPARFKKTQKTLYLLSQNPRHPGLQTHKFDGRVGPNGEEVFEAYIENRTPAAYRAFWYYGPDKQQITILAITPHP